MRRFTAPQWAGLGLLAATIVCTFAGRPEGTPAVAGGEEGDRSVRTEPGMAPAPVEEKSCEKSPVEKEPGGKERVEKEPVAEKPAEKEPAENPSAKEDLSEKNPLSGCQQCHIDIEDEYAVSLHFKEKTACTDCHGPSEGHVADENNEIKPDEVFARKDVNRLCGKCHDDDCSRPTDAESAADRSKVCIDCHYPHDLTLKKETQ